MLIFGDTVTRKVNPSHEIKSIEIIYHDLEEFAYILNLYDLKEYTYNSVSYTEYKKKGIIYKLYNINIALILKKIVKDNFGFKYKQAIASPFTSFIFDSIKVVNYHAKFDDWLHRAESYICLGDTFIKDLISFDDKYEGYIMKQHNMLKGFVDCQPNIVRRPYTYHPYTIFTKHELLEIVTTTVINHSPLNLMTDDYVEKGNDLVESKFESFSYQQQVTAAVESLYVDTLNDFVIPYMRSHDGKFPTDKEVYRNYLRSIMYRTSQVETAWLGHFMLENFDAVIDDYDIGFYNAFMNAVKFSEMILKKGTKNLVSNL